MNDMNNDLHVRAVKALSENEVRKMEHCVGFDRKKIYHHMIRAAFFRLAVRMAGL